MNLSYYSIPLNLYQVGEKKELSTCSLTESVNQNLHLIFTTAFGEMLGDENFGCIIWDHDFDNMSGANKTKELIKQSLLISIQQYEKRLSNVRIDVLIRQQEYPVKLAGYWVKKLIHITVSGVLIATNESYKYQDTFYSGPLSY